MHKHLSRQSLRHLGLAVFIVGAFYASVPSVNKDLADIPWEYMPAATVKAAGAFYTVNFIPLAEQYLAVVDGAGEVQAGAYSALGRGASAAAAALSQSKPVAATAEWYVDLNSTVNFRLSPR